MEHAHSVNESRRRPLLFVLWLTSAFLIVEVVGGLATRSLALLADAGHMLTDVGGLALALFAVRMATRPATPERTYGYYRAEILAALANAVVLILVSGYILVEAYERFRNPPTVIAIPMMGIALLGLLVNGGGILILRRDSEKSLNLKGAYYEVLADLLSSVGVLLAGAVMWATGWRYADPIVSAAIGLFILPRTWQLMKQVVGILLEGTPAGVEVAALREALLSVDGVTGVHDLHVWCLTSHLNAMSAHVVSAEQIDRDALLRRVHDRVRSGFPIGHVTIQLEAPGWEEAETHL